VTVLGIIGGSGLTSLEGLQLERRSTAGTPWGKPSGPLLHGRMAGRPVVFLARHGSDHALAPHEVNYRANIWALHGAGVRRVIAVNAVGGISERYHAGALAIPHQLVDYSWGRAQTFCGEHHQPLQHIDFTAPYTPAMRTLLLEAAARAGLDAIDGGVYAVTQGPRLETAAEIDRLARDGCDLVGMTGMPEAGLARELDMEYACCAVVVNRAAGRGIDIHDEFDRWVREGMVAARRVIHAVLAGQAPS